MAEVEEPSEKKLVQARGEENGGGRRSIQATNPPLPVPSAPKIKQKRGLDSHWIREFSISFLTARNFAI